MVDLLGFSKYLTAAIWGITKDVTYMLQFCWLKGRQKYVLYIGKVSAWRKADSDVSQIP